MYKDVGDVWQDSSNQFHASCTGVNCVKSFWNIYEYIQKYRPCGLLLLNAASWKTWAEIPQNRHLREGGNLFQWTCFTPEPTCYVCKCVFSGFWALRPDDKWIYKGHHRRQCVNEFLWADGEQYMSAGMLTGASFQKSTEELTDIPAIQYISQHIPKE